MKLAPTPANETDRLNALAQYEILDTLPEEVYDDITRIAAEITGTPIALLNLIDKNRLWTKSHQGIDVDESPRDSSFCAHAILDPDEIMVVEDTRLDDRFHDNPLVTHEPLIIFYAGVPIVDNRGYALGTLCIMDNRPRTLPENKFLALKALAKLVNVHFELRKTRLELDRVHKTFNQSGNPAAVLESAGQALSLVNLIETNLQFLLKNHPDPVQAPRLSALQEAVQALKSALDHPNTLNSGAS
jgi:GAF domain-containing protein